MNGNIISKEDIATLAALPSREVLLGKVANVLNAPLAGLASALCGIITKIAYALNAVKDKKEASEPTKEAPEEAPKEETKEEKKPEAPAERQGAETTEKTEEKKKEDQEEES